MASKRPLIKQKVTYGSVGDGNLDESDEDFSGKQSLTKRVSFHEHELSESDSDEENSVGRINRSSSRPARDSLDGLFRESGSKEKEGSVGLTKGTSVERQGSKDKGQPRPVPRSRPTISARQSHFKSYSVTPSQQSSDEEEDMSAMKESIKTKETKDRQPVPPPRTSPRQHPEKSSSSDMVSPRPVPRSRPALSPSEGRLKLFQQDSDVYNYEKTRTGARDTEVHEYKESKKAADKPVAPLRRKKTLEETHQGIRSQIPKIRTSTFEDDGLFPENNDGTEFQQDGNLRHGQFKKVKGRPVISVTRSDSSEESESEDDSGMVDNRTGLFGRKKYYKDDQNHDRHLIHSKEEPVSVPPKPSPRSRMKQMFEDSDQKDNHVKRPGSAPLMEKASSLETLRSKQDSLTLKDIYGPKEQGAQRVQLKKSLTPQRPISAKKGSWMGQSDITDTFEEHVPSAENIITGTPDDRSFRKKGASDIDSGGSKGRSGPLKANQAISSMVRSPHPRETPTDVWTDTNGTTHSRTLTPKRSSSMTNLRGTSPDLWSESGSARSSHSGLMDTTSIRQAVFDEWKSKKSVRLKEQLASKSAEKKKLEEKEKEEHERKKLAKRAFESWNEMKQEDNKVKNAKKTELMNKELEKKKEQNLRARDAKKYFESWKAKKDEELKEQHQKKKGEERNKKKKDEEKEKEKSVDSQKAFENWKKKKDEKLTEEFKKKRREKNDNSMKEEEEKYERSIQCAERYQAWVEKKGKPRRGPPPPTLTQRSWCPSGRKSGNFIPDKVGSVIQAPVPNRSRTMSGSYYFKTNKF